MKRFMLQEIFFFIFFLFFFLFCLRVKKDYVQDASKGLFRIHFYHFSTHYLAVSVSHAVVRRYPNLYLKQIKTLAKSYHQSNLFFYDQNTTFYDQKTTIYNQKTTIYHQITFSDLLRPDSHLFRCGRKWSIQDG